MKKKIGGSLLAILVSCLLCSGVNAKQVYYTNEEGVEMTELEYNKMVQIYSERYVEHLSQDEFDNLKDANIVSSETLYQKTTYDSNGKMISEELISEEEYNDAPDSESSTENDIMPFNDDYKYVETTYKKLSGTLADFGSRSYTMVGAVSWKKIPVIRSYDVFAYRFMHFDYSGFNGSQVYYVNGAYNNISYNTSSPGYKAQGSGAGVSMNLVDGSNITGYELTVSTGLTVNTTSYSQAHAYISYQHAQSDLTREQSLGYTLNVSGLGNVILFSSSYVASQYDGMDGVHLTTAI